VATASQPDMDEHLNSEQLDVFGRWPPDGCGLREGEDFPASNFNDFVAHVKTNKERVIHGHAGIGSASHLCGLLFLNAIEVTVTVVPYKGTGPALNDLIGGQFDFMCDQTLNVLQPVKAGLIKAYAATTKKRLAVLPDLPTAPNRACRTSRSPSGSACGRPRVRRSP
jgi:Tripartite tricarboxylate transporter family receptor